MDDTPAPRQTKARVKLEDNSDNRQLLMRHMEVIEVDSSEDDEDDAPIDDSEPPPKQAGKNGSAPVVKQGGTTKSTTNRSRGKQGDAPSKGGAKRRAASPAESDSEQRNKKAKPEKRSNIKAASTASTAKGSYADKVAQFRLSEERVNGLPEERRKSLMMRLEKPDIMIGMGNVHFDTAEDDETQPKIATGAIHDRSINVPVVKQIWEQSNGGKLIYNDSTDFAMTIVCSRRDVDMSTLTMSYIGPFEDVKFHTTKKDVTIFLLNGNHRRALLQDYVIKDLDKRMKTLNKLINDAGEGDAIEDLIVRLKGLRAARQSQGKWLCKFYSSEGIHAEKDDEVDLLLCLASNVRPITADETGTSIIWTMLKELRALGPNPSERTFAAKLQLTVTQMVDAERRTTRLRNILLNPTLMRTLTSLSDRRHFSLITAEAKEKVWYDEKKFEVISQHVDVIFEGLVGTGIALLGILNHECFDIAPSKASFLAMPDKQQSAHLRQYGAQIMKDLEDGTLSLPSDDVLSALDSAYIEHLEPIFFDTFGTAAGSSTAKTWSDAFKKYREHVLSNCPAIESVRFFYLFETALLSHVGRSFAIPDTCWPLLTKTVLASLVTLCLPRTNGKGVAGPEDMKPFKNLCMLITGMIDFRALKPNTSEKKTLSERTSGWTMVIQYIDRNTKDASTDQAVYRLTLLFLKWRLRGWQDALNFLHTMPLKESYPEWRQTAKRVDATLAMEMGVKETEYAKFEDLAVSFLVKGRDEQSNAARIKLSNADLAAIGPLRLALSRIIVMLRKTSHAWHIVQNTTTKPSDQVLSLWNSILLALSRIQVYEDLLDRPLFSEIRHDIFQLCDNRDDYAESYSCGWDKLPHGDADAFKGLSADQVMLNAEVQRGERRFIEFSSKLDKLINQYALFGTAPKPRAAAEDGDERPTCMEEVGRARNDLLKSVYFSYAKEGALIQDPNLVATDLDMTWAREKLESEGVVKLNLNYATPQEVDEYFEEFQETRKALIGSPMNTQSTLQPEASGSGSTKVTNKKGANLSDAADSLDGNGE
ncbi:hypothetical protein BDZ89DRAFT_1079249 [Hymenopellis radicata]|nr:hypothetical protein BDZ89DRAFT_1079249 [Hymenopellis radicata]